MSSSIFRPELRFTSHELEILKVLAEILTAQSNSEGSQNYDRKEAVLSEEEATKLADLLSKLVENQDFVTKSHFLHALSDHSMEYGGYAFKLYKKSVIRGGRTFAMARAKWSEFNMRFGGLAETHVRYGWSERMSFAHFYRMEKRLFEELRVDPFLMSYLLIELKKIERKIEQARDEGAHTPVVIKSEIDWFTKKLNSGKRIVERTNLASLFVCIANTGVFFTTRDWGVAGGISSIGGALLSVKK